MPGENTCDFRLARFGICRSEGRFSRAQPHNLCLAPWAVISMYTAYLFEVT